MLDIRKNRGVSSFTILALEVSLELGMHISLRILNLMGEIKLETLTFRKNMTIVLIQKAIKFFSFVQADVSRPSASYSQIEYPQEEAPLKESTIREATQISNNLSIYLQEHEADMEIRENDPINLWQVLQSFNAHKWIDAMNDEMKSMHDNDVWDLVKLLEILKPIGCKWIFKTKMDSKGNGERYKVHLVAKGFTQYEGIDYNKIFSPVSSKDSFRIIMTLIAHFDLELHQMDVKTAFLNGEIDETIYMEQPENFVIGNPKFMVCKLKKSLYGLKQSPWLWYYKFHKIISSFDFVINPTNECIYHKFSGSKYTFSSIICP